MNKQEKKIFKFLKDVYNLNFKSCTILSVLVCIGICWLVNFIPHFVFTFAYLIGLGNGMLILGTLNQDD